MINWFLDKLADRIAIKVKQDLIKEMAWDVFSTLGLEELDNIVKQGKQNQEKEGNTNYTNLGKIYEERLRTMAIKRLEEVIKKLTSELFI